MFGGVLSIVNIAHVAFPARSVTMSVCVHSLAILSPLEILTPSTFALSLKVMVTLPE
ncbi:MAG: hypothetical protein WCH65_05895 [bacterium]